MWGGPVVGCQSHKLEAQVQFLAPQQICKFELLVRSF